MSNTIEFYFDFVSPYSYLAQTQMAKLQQETGAEIQYKPVLLGGHYQLLDVKAPPTIPNKRDWINRDSRLWAEHYGVPIVWNPIFPFNTISLLRTVLWLEESKPEAVAAFVDQTFNAIWQNGLDVHDQQAVADHITACGFDMAEVMAGIGQDSVKQALKDSVSDAHDKGLFGLPAFMVKGDVFFGQDRLMFVKDAFNAQKA